MSCSFGGRLLRPWVMLANVIEARSHKGAWRNPVLSHPRIVQFLSGRPVGVRENPTDSLLSANGTPRSSPVDHYAMRGEALRAWSAARDAPTGHCPRIFPQGPEKYPACSNRKPQIFNCLHVREAAQSLPRRRAVGPNAASINVHYSAPGRSARSTVA